MKLKDTFKSSFFFPLAVYCRYWIYRFLFNRAFLSYKINKDIDVIPIDDGIVFFGYYNISPENEKGEILYLKVNQQNARGSLLEPASIMLKKTDGTISKIAETKAWNWQQGCMLQWLPNNSNNILFNDFNSKNGSYITRIVDISGNLVKEINMPVNNVSKCGKFALSLNYDRLSKMRPDYGYFNRLNIPLPKNENDGIWFVNLENNTVDLLITLKQLSNLSWSETMEGAMHKVNHIDINPSGTRFMFLHRWNGPKGRFMRLITANIDGTEICILNGDVMTSHCCWLNDNEILSFCEVNSRRGYFKFLDKSDKFLFFSNNMPLVDGHPSISPNGEFIVTDTYPNIARFSSLLLYKIENDLLMKLGEFYQPLKYKTEMRIDLHPKWGLTNSTIFFESGHKFNRKLYKLVIL